MIRRFTSSLLLCALVAVFLTSSSPLLHAQTASLEISGWIPYWATTAGTKDARKHLDELDVIHPFGYSVKQNGTLHDLMNSKKSSWQRLIKAARKEDVLVIPTVMWSDGAHIHSILSNEALRSNHIKAIVSMVKKGKFDGVDIDYEAKRSETRDYYSLFLKELKGELGSKILSCTIEARTPPDSLYRVIPPTINYVNDYSVIGEHCDRVQLMTYDQRRADIKLNAAKAGEPYMPIADTDWVRKVVLFTMQSIPKEKLVLGIPTYGHEYEITVSPDWYRNYARVSAINPPAALKLAKQEKVTASRNRAGEMSFSYASDFSAPELRSRSLSITPTASGNIIAARGLAYANATGNTTIFNYVTWSDVESVKAKVELAAELGIRGVAFFKIDGEEDKDIWSIVADY